MVSVQILGALAVAVVVYLLGRHAMYWGATEEELQMALPGDAVVSNPILKTTHGVTVNAPVEAVWPWLVQIGHRRAGWYVDARWWSKLVSWYYQLLSDKDVKESSAGQPVATLNRVDSDLQTLNPGDVILDGPPGTVFFEVRTVEPNKALVLYSNTHLPYLVPRSVREDPRWGIYGELSVSYVLRELGPAATRLVLRHQARYGPGLFWAFATPIILGWGELITSRLQLRGIKHRAEQHSSAEQVQRLSGHE